MTLLRKAARLGEHVITIETGRLAKQASGSVLVTCGESMVLVTAVVGPHKPDAFFFPLVVDYIEKAYAGGRVPGGFLKREGRLSDHEILTSRIADRPIRPLFPEGYKGDTQITATVLSHDGEYDTDVLALTGASAALMISPAPFEGPVAGVRVGRIDGKFIANPSLAQQKHCEINIVMACTKDAIVMVEGEAKELSEAEVLLALDFGFAAVQPLLDLQIEMAREVGKPKMVFVAQKPDPALVARFRELVMAPTSQAIVIRDKLERYAKLKEIKKGADAVIAETWPGAKTEEIFDDLKSEIMREMILADRKRIDGRGLSDIRQITSEAGLLPRPHGSALFTRGETQVLSTVTLGTGRDAKMVDGLNGKHDEHFMLHYNFPPFSVGEVKPLRGPGRREVGHGFLAQKSLEQIIPTHEEFPYVLRLVAETLESNGSSSMATVCSGSMALMDAGVPVKKSCAGIAMGLIHDGKRWAVLSDILGDEDHLGDMDFKVTGTRDGICALQMDIKIKGLTRDVMELALAQAREGRMHILGIMDREIATHRPELSRYAPQIITIQIASDRIRDVIGSGGKTIRSIQERTGCQIEVGDDGTVKVAAVDRVRGDEAVEIIKALTASPVPGEIYLGTVAKVAEFGAFVTILPNVDGLCHISELSDERVERTEDIVREGDEIIVKCVAIEGGGKIRLSRKEALGKKPTVASNKLLA